MALRGNLRDFSLPDVFQLVAYSRKTGLLRITRPDGVEGGVWFRDGDVFFARSDWNIGQLGERLVAADRITPAALERGLEIREAQGEDGPRLGRILVDEGFITESVLEAFVQEQIQDTIFDLMRWEDGEFDFEVLPDVVEEDIGLSVSLENIVMEGSRRLEEWERIRKKIPSVDVVLKMATAPAEGTYEISLKPIEWSLLLLVDGTRSISELAAETDRTDFEVARIAYGLLSTGLLEFAGDEEVAQLRAERAEREEREEAARREAEERARAEAEAEAARKAAAEEAARKAAEEAARKAAEEEARRVAEEEARKAAEEEARRAAEEEARKAAEEEAARAAEEAAARAAETEGARRAAEQEQTAALADELAATLADGSAPEPVAEQREPVEDPTFLAGAERASEHDLSVFEEMVAAVLEKPPAPPEPEPVAPHVPAEVPPSVGAPQGVDAEPFDAVDAAELLGMEPAPVVPVETPEQPAVSKEAPPASAPEVAPEPAPQAAAAAAPATPEQAPAPEVAPEPAPQAAPAAAPAEPEQAAEDDFERDLMALGLGEAPTPQVELEPAVETPPPAAPAEPAIIEMPVEEEPEPESRGEATDLTALLQSLESEDADVSEDKRSARTAATDIEIDEAMSYGPGLNDELSALTGADRPARPSATVNKLPDEGAPSHQLHRDGTIDRATLLKIIDGIEKL